MDAKKAIELAHENIAKKELDKIIAKINAKIADGKFNLLLKSTILKENKNFLLYSGYNVVEEEGDTMITWGEKGE